MDRTKQAQPEKVKVLVNLDNEAVAMADAMSLVREFDSRSAYVRKLIKDDWKREQRRIARLQAQT